MQNNVLGAILALSIVATTHSAQQKPHVSNTQQPATPAQIAQAVKRFQSCASKRSFLKKLQQTVINLLASIAVQRNTETLKITCNQLLAIKGAPACKDLIKHAVQDCQKHRLGDSSDNASLCSSDSTTLPPIICVNGSPLSSELSLSSSSSSSSRSVSPDRLDVLANYYRKNQP